MEPIFALSFDAFTSLGFWTSVASSPASTRSSRWASS